MKLIFTMNVLVTGLHVIVNSFVFIMCQCERNSDSVYAFQTRNNGKSLSRYVLSLPFMLAVSDSFRSFKPWNDTIFSYHSWTEGNPRVSYEFTYRMFTEISQHILVRMLVSSPNLPPKSMRGLKPCRNWTCTRSAIVPYQELHVVVSWHRIGHSFECFWQYWLFSILYFAIVFLSESLSK